MASAPLQVLVVGTGKRVLETALPAFASQPESFRIHSLFARRPKTVTAAGSDYEVAAFETFGQEHLQGIDLVYLAVTKDAVPSVLGQLARLDLSRADVLIDTPVVRFKHFRHADKLGSFRQAWVAEDVAFLPWIDTVRQVFAGGSLGSLRTLLLQQSAYAYHGVALAKALGGSQAVKSGRRLANSSQAGLRHMELANGVRVAITEPRNYATGRICVAGSKGSLGDFAFQENTLLLEPLVEGGLLRGFRCGEFTTRLNDAEAQLTAGDPEDASVTARTNACKRVGFARLLGSIAAGQGGYPLGEALDDMVVDYHLEKFSRYRANPFTSSRSPLAKLLLKTASRAGG